LKGKGLEKENAFSFRFQFKAVNIQESSETWVATWGFCILGINPQVRPRLRPYYFIHHITKISIFFTNIVTSNFAWQCVVEGSQKQGFAHIYRPEVEWDVLVVLLEEAVCLPDVKIMELVELGVVISFPYSIGSPIWSCQMAKHHLML
jgi:hypothetical protein